MAPKKPAPHVDLRARQDTPQDLISDILQAIRSGFYTDQDPKKWYQDRGFILKNIVLWPASWLNKRGVTLPPARYKAIVLGVIQEIKRHGRTSAVAYWPGYLRHCLQTHFQHHGDEIYEEGKSLRSVLDRTVGTLRPAPETRPVEQLAEAYRLTRLAPKKPRSTKPAAQLELL